MGESGNTPQETRIVKAIERSRIAVCFVAMFLGHSDYFRTFAALTVFSLAGLTAVESFFFGDVSARAQIKFAVLLRPRLNHDLYAIDRRDACSTGRRRRHDGVTGDAVSSLLHGASTG